MSHLSPYESLTRIKCSSIWVVDMDPYESLIWIHMSGWRASNALLLDMTRVNATHVTTMQLMSRACHIVSCLNNTTLVCACDILAYDILACDILACDILACDILACDILACDMSYDERLVSQSYHSRMCHVTPASLLFNICSVSSSHESRVHLTWANESCVHLTWVLCTSDMSLVYIWHREMYTTLVLSSVSRDMSERVLCTSDMSTSDTRDRWANESRVHLTRHLTLMSIWPMSCRIATTLSDSNNLIEEQGPYLIAIMCLIARRDAW